MRYSTHLLLAGALSALACSPALAQGDAARGQQWASQGDGSGAPCLACHGANGEGNDAGGFPRLAGLDADYLTKQMQDYRSGARVSPIMQPNVDSFSEAQIRDLATYYAGLPSRSVTVTGTVSDKLLALGETLANNGDWDSYIPPCATCHGPGNRGVGASFPALAGQSPNYLSQQLKTWQSGQRHNDPNQLMAAVATRLNDQQIQAVAAYLGRLNASDDGEIKP